MNKVNMKVMKTQINNVKNKLRNEMKNSIQASLSNQTNEIKNMMDSLFQMNTASTSGLGSLHINTVANPKGELKSITTQSGIVLDGPSVLTPPLFINPEVDERVEETLTDQDLSEYTIKVSPPPIQKYKPPSQRDFFMHQRDTLHPNIPYSSRMLKQKQQEKDELSFPTRRNFKNWQTHPLMKIAQRLSSRSYLKNLETMGSFQFHVVSVDLKCKALVDLGASINLMPLSVWKKLGLPELISTRMNLELANRAICTPAGIARDVFIPVGKFTFPTDFVIVDYESDPRVPLILGRPFLRTTHALIDVHGEEMILHDGDERLTLNMRHDTSSYSNQPHKESINLINVFNDSSEDFLEDLFSTNQPSGNPTFSFHSELTSLKVKYDIFDPEGGNVQSEKLLDLDSTKDLHPPHHVNPLSGSTTYSFSPNQLLEEFADELALITFPPEYEDDLQFDIASDLKEIEYLLYHDPIEDIDSSLKDSIDQSNFADLNDNLVDSMPEMFTDEHALDYSSPPLFDEYDDDLFKVESDTEHVYDDPFDSKGEKIKESKLLIDELDIPCDFLPFFEYDSFISEDFSRVDALPSTNNEDNVFKSGILIQENLFEIITRVVQDKKLVISNASLMLEDFNPPIYELPFFKEVPRLSIRESSRRMKNDSAESEVSAKQGLFGNPKSAYVQIVSFSPPRWDYDPGKLLCCFGFTVTPKTSHLQAVKRIFRYLKGQPKLGLWYPKVSSFNLEAYSDSDYAGANLDRKSTTRSCQFLGRRLISWQCKKQTIVATSTTEAEYVVVAHCCGQVLWIQNQLLDSGFNLMNTKIYINNESTICIVKNPVFHYKTKHIKIRHHFIRDAYEKKLIQVLKFHTDDYVADLLTKAFDVSSKELAIPKQTTLGKDKSNPLIVDSLLKTIWLSMHHGITMKHWLFQIKRPLVVVTEDVIRKVLCLDDADGVECLPNEDIFTELTRMGYEKLPPKLMFYKTFFSTQWKFLIHTLVQFISAKRTAWNEFSCSMASAVICLATGRKFNFSKYIFNSMVRNVDSPNKFLIVGKGFFGVGTPLFATMLVQPQAEVEEDDVEDQEVREEEEILVFRFKEIKEGERIKAIDADKDVTLVDAETQVDLGAELRRRKDDDNVVIKEVSDAEPTVFDDEEVTMTMAQTLIKMKAEKARLHDEQMAKRLHDEEVEQAAAREKQNKDDLEKAKVLQKQYEDKQENIDWNTVAEKMQEKHLDNIRKYQSLKRKPIYVAQARKNMIVYLKNMAGYKMEHFKGMTYVKVWPIFEREYNKVQTLFKPDKDVDEEPTKKRVAKETLLQDSFKKLKAVKVSVTEFKVEALQVKYPLIDWEIHSKGSRSYWKIIRVGGITQAYKSFEDMLKDFNREDLDVL
uniref:Putative ribonuclease H-like domain-containing protein n=1 Tax=Tanacetum cinerariifolium TaxID=118510 RepID=A0A699GN17_TANCI|nr:putative ribonuclease H-like domain-containing protein [Tanacetum cinerariifolium]